jgi:fatty-acyl-CoA synthase
MLSTMQDFPLSVQMILRHGRRVYARSEVVTFEGDHCRRATFAEVGDRAERLAGALARLGVGAGDRIGTFMWNNQEHLEAYLAVPSMGAVLHTLNIRLFPEQLAYVANHADDRVIIANGSILPLLARIKDQLTTVEHIVVTGAGDRSVLDGGAGYRVHEYEALLAGAPAVFDWPEIDERSACAMCYTSGTTGNPKGVAYSHRSTWLHSLAVTSASTLGVCEADRVLAIVPMFHANAWGMPYAAFMAGADLLMPQQHLQAEPLVRLIEAERPTFSGGVPTVWADIVRYGETHDIDLSSFRMIIAGGSAVPRSLIEKLEARHGVRLIQAWGMTASRRWRGGPGPGGSWLVWSCGSAATAARSCRGTAPASARSRCEARGSPRRTTSTPTRRSSTTGGSAPATSRSSTITASCRSPTGPRTS